MSALMAFDAAARHSSITRAADELALTESAVSRQISLLEDQLGVPLFNRVKKRLSLTRAGMAYARNVAEVLARLEADTLSVMTHEGASGVLEIAALPTVGALWLIPRMPDLYGRAPGLLVNVSARASRFLFDETNYDGALCFGAATWPGARSDFLFEEELVAVAGGALRERESWSVDAILGQRLLHLATRSDAWERWATAAGAGASNVLKGLRFETQSMVIEAASAGLGVALAPVFLIENQLRRGELQIISEIRIICEGAYYFAFPEQKAEEPELKLFRQWLQEHAERFRSAGGLAGGSERGGPLQAVDHRDAAQEGTGQFPL